MTYERDIAATENANIEACKETRRINNLPEAEDVTNIDCATECEIYNTVCPLRRKAP